MKERLEMIGMACCSQSVSLISADLFSPFIIYTEAKARHALVEDPKKAQCVCKDALNALGNKNRV